MKNYMLLLALLFTFQFTKAQSECVKVETTLQKYMEGSSYNKLDLLESAFTEDATLYLTLRDGSFKSITPKDYVGFFKNGETGKFNGREAKVLAIEVVKDIATAKVEIAGPERQWVYIDLFLLKKFENSWKIISKTATRVDNAASN
ncbi:nuclear transport factor 2 family protein [Pontimicrobium sp. MEBiC01747]